MESYEKHKKSGPKMTLSQSKRLSHFSGITVGKKGKIPADIQENSEIYIDLFCLPLCYVHMIWIWEF